MYLSVWVCNLLLCLSCFAADPSVRRLQHASTPATPTVPRTTEINGQVFILVPADQTTTPPVEPVTTIQPLVPATTAQSAPVSTASSVVIATQTTAAPVQPSIPDATAATVPQTSTSAPQTTTPLERTTTVPPATFSIPTPPGGWPVGFEPLTPAGLPVQPQIPQTTTAAPRVVNPPLVPQPPQIPLFSTTQTPGAPVPPVVSFPPTLNIPSQTTAAPVVPSIPVPPGGWPVNLQLPQFTMPTTTTRQPLPGHMFGAFGQDCPVPTGVEQCQIVTDLVTDQAANTPGRVSCSLASDCCFCKQIQCGTPGSTPCDALILSGSKAAFGVQDIQVHTGDVGTGIAVIQCSGEQSCEKAKIVGNGVQSVECRGRYACKDATITIDDPANEFFLECSVTSSCENLNIVVNYNGPSSNNVCNPDPLAARNMLMRDIACVGVISCQGMTFTINNNGCDPVIIQNVELRRDTAIGASFNFYGSTAIGIRSCQLPVTGMPTGLERCFTNLRVLSCSDRASCMEQTRTIISPANNFMLECVNEMSCANAKFTFEITAEVKSPPTEMIKIVCSSPMACQGLQITATNANAVPVYFEVTCSGTGSCDQASFSMGPNTFLPEVTCGAASECMGCLFDGQTCGGHPAILTGQTPGMPQGPPASNIPGLPGQLLPGTPYTVPAPQPFGNPQQLIPQNHINTQPVQPQQPYSPWPQSQAYNPWWTPQAQQPAMPQTPMNAAPQFVYNPNPFV